MERRHFIKGALILLGGSAVTSTALARYKDYPAAEVPPKIDAHLRESFGSEDSNSVYSHFDTTEEIKGLEISGLTKIIYTHKYARTSNSLSKNILIRDSHEDRLSHANSDWKTNGVINQKALLFDIKGKAFRLMPTYGYVTLEALGGGEGVDDAALMDIAQVVSTSPVRVVANKTYKFSRPVKHTAGRGWIGMNTTFLGPSIGNRVPFISSVTNDATNGTSGVNNARFEGIIIDTNYLDVTGVIGFNFAENTLDNWQDCVFYNVTFKNSKFDNLALQNNCKRVHFRRCNFFHAGEDGVTIRKTCENISFFESKIIDTAQVAKNGFAYGDGIVVKGKFTTIDSCYFKNVGNHIKGAGIANNAEDVDNIFQASYGTYVNNQFDACYGGIGIGTVNPEFITAGQLIEGITLDNNTYVNTDANAVGLRHVRDLNHGKCKIIGQNLPGYYSIELINVVNLDGIFDVRSAQGGAVVISNCNGKAQVTAFDVSKGENLNSATITRCDRLQADVKIDTSSRNGMEVNAFSNGRIDFRGKNIKLQGASFENISQTILKCELTDCGNNGVTIVSANDCPEIDIKAIDCGTVANNTYASLRLMAGKRNKIKLFSSSRQINKPKYDLIVEGRVAETSLDYTANAGVTARTLISQNTVATKIKSVK